MSIVQKTCYFLEGSFLYFMEIFFLDFGENKYQELFFCQTTLKLYLKMINPHFPDFFGIYFRFHQCQLAKNKRWLFSFLLLAINNINAVLSHLFWKHFKNKKVLPYTEFSFQITERFFVVFGSGWVQLYDKHSFLRSFTSFCPNVAPKFSSKAYNVIKICWKNRVAISTII